MDLHTPASAPLVLGDIADELPVLEIACSRCALRKRFYTDRLIARHGRAKPLMVLLRDLSANCACCELVPQQSSCSAHFRGLERIRARKSAVEAD